MPEARLTYAAVTSASPKWKSRTLLWLRVDGKRAIRLLLCLEAAWWALDLALPWPTFATSRVYDLLGSLAPEWVWAALFAVDAALLAWGFAGGRLRRIGSAGLDGLFHGVVVTSAMVSVPASTAVGTQTVWLIASYMLLEWEAMDG